MLNFWHPKQILDEKKDGGGGGATPPVVPPATPPATPPVEPGDGTGVPSAKDLGYEEDPPATPPGTPPAKKDGDPPADPPATPPKVEIKDPATGYSKDLPEVKDEPPATPPAAPDPKDAEIEKHLGDGLPKEDVQKIKEFAKANELTEKQLKAYGDLRRKEIGAIAAAEAKFAEDAVKAKAKVHFDWQTELKKDPVFGGDKYQANVTMVERLVQDFFPEYKKRLTDTGSMMPPYLMRDLAKLATSVYKTDNLVHGDPVTPPAEPVAGDGKKNNPLDFYE